VPELTFVILTLLCHGPLSPFLPATYEPILLYYGQVYPPVAVAIVGALTATLAELVNYYLYRSLLRCRPLDRLMLSRGARPVRVVFARHPFLAIWICAWSPLPDWAARMLASHSGYSVRRYLTAFVAGRVPKFWLLAALGSQWMPSGKTVAVIAVASGLFTLIAAGRRHTTKAATQRFSPVPGVVMESPLLTSVPGPR
jgi:uncharacterized membrane protein YdjX (TVP38/TMEM64 family)